MANKPIKIKSLKKGDKDKALPKNVKAALPKHSEVEAPVALDSAAAKSLYKEGMLEIQDIKEQIKGLNNRVKDIQTNIKDKCGISKKTQQMTLMFMKWEKERQEEVFSELHFAASTTLFSMGQLNLFGSTDAPETPEVETPEEEDDTDEEEDDNETEDAELEAVGGDAKSKARVAEIKKSFSKLPSNPLKVAINKSAKS